MKFSNSDQNFNRNIIWRGYHIKKSRLHSGKKNYLNSRETIPGDYFTMNFAKDSYC